MSSICREKACLVVEARDALACIQTLFKLVLYLAAARECGCVSVEIMIMSKATQVRYLVRMSNNKDDQLLTVFISWL